jgi:hypothetical protein
VKSLPTELAGFLRALHVCSGREFLNFQTIQKILNKKTLKKGVDKFPEMRYTILKKER